LRDVRQARADRSFFVIQLDIAHQRSLAAEHLGHAMCDENASAQSMRANLEPGTRLRERVAARMPRSRRSVRPAHTFESIRFRFVRERLVAVVHHDFE